MSQKMLNEPDSSHASSSKTIQLVTFRCGELLVGLDLTDVQEINRQSNIAAAPEAPPHVRGVINLRGEVITMIDLKIALRQTDASQQTTAHNVFVRWDDEVIGLITDGVSDILTVASDGIDPSPSNVRGAEANYFRGVYTTEDAELVLMLDLEQVLGQSESTVVATGR